MDALTVLKRCRAAAADIERLQIRISQRREVLDGIGAPQADPNGGSRPGGDVDRMGRVFGDLDELEREREARKEMEKAERVAAVTLLDMVPDLEGLVLYDYYVRRQDTGTIARERKYTAGYVRKTKRNGEQLLGMISEERVNATLPAWYLREEARRAGDRHGHRADP